MNLIAFKWFKLKLFIKQLIVIILSVKLNISRWETAYTFHHVQSKSDFIPIVLLYCLKTLNSEKNNAQNINKMTIVLTH